MYLFLPDMDLWKYQLTGEYLFTFSALLAYAISSLMELLKKLSEYRKSITISLICENLRPIYRIISFLPLSNFAVFDGCCFTMINIVIIIIIIYLLLLAKHCTNFSNKPTLSSCIRRHLLWVSSYANGKTMTSAKIRLFVGDWKFLIPTKNVKA